MTDRFNNYELLHNEMVMGQHYRILQKVPEGSVVAIMAPHGGGIEPHTSELTKAIAKDDFAYYCFEGMLSSNNRDLHITSHNFDEPGALRLAGNVDFVVGVHGMQNRKDDVHICLGGLDCDLIELLSKELTEIGITNITSGHDFPATNPQNICNRGASERGAQLEISRTMRNTLFNDELTLAEFSNSIRQAISSRVDE